MICQLYAVNAIEEKQNDILEEENGVLSKPCKHTIVTIVIVFVIIRDGDKVFE